MTNDAQLVRLRKHELVADVVYRMGALQVVVRCIPTWMAWTADDPPQYYQSFIEMCHNSHVGIAHVDDPTRVTVRIDLNRVSPLLDVLDAFAISLRYDVIYAGKAYSEAFEDD